MDSAQLQPGLITAVERQKRSKHRYNLFVDGDYAFSVHEDILVKHRLLKGEHIDRTRMESIVQDDERHQAYLEAIRYIGRRPRSHKEVKLHLKEKGYEPDRIAEILERLQSERYLDDEAFAKLWTEHRIVSQRKGRRWVQMELADKGVDEGDIARALGGIDPEEEYAGAWELGRKKWRTTGGELLERKRKVMAFLLRRGYSNELVSRVLRELAAGNEYGEEQE
ncbi:MAG: RecX family transcriptional regulator [Paenibacillaceae bacterium]|jgi:regulatory protein|nr:RecX family transcriptional regulator [Paenibacillaceae bacterium]